MRCDKAFPYLQSIADGEQKGWMLRRVAKHLAACPKCQEILEKMSGIRKVLQERLPRHSAPSRLESRILQSVHVAHIAVAPKTRSFSFRPVQFAVVTILSVAVIWILIQVAATTGQIRAGAFAHQVAILHAQNEEISAPNGENYQLTSDPAAAIRFFEDHRVGFKVQIPIPEGLHLGGVSRNMVDDIPVACLMFGGNASICFFMTKADTMTFPPDRYLTLLDGTHAFCQRIPPSITKSSEEFGVLMWRQGNMCYTLVSSSSDEELMRYAREFKRLLV